MLYYTYRVEVCMKYCTNCGKKLIQNSNYCDECGTKVIVEEKTVSNEIINNDGNWKYYVLANVILIFGNIFLGLDNYGSISMIAALVIIITAKIKYPKVTIVQVLFWVEIIFTLMIFIYAIILMIMCTNFIMNCG